MGHKKQVAGRRAPGLDQKSSKCKETTGLLALLLILGIPTAPARAGQHPAGLDMRRDPKMTVNPFETNGFLGFLIIFLPRTSL